MHSIRRFFGEAGNDLFDVMPHEGWPQRAPVIGDHLAFNQKDCLELPMVSGAMVLTPSVDIEGIQITYAPHKLMRGFVIGRKTIHTNPFDKLTIQDYSDHVHLATTFEDTVFSHNLSQQEKAAVTSLFATAALDKYLRLKARKEVEINNLANPDGQ